MTQRTRYSISSNQQFPILIFLRNWRYQICLYKEITMINTSCDHTFSPHNKIVFDANDANSRRENLHTYIERSEPSPPLPHPLPPSLLCRWKSFETYSITRLNGARSSALPSMNYTRRGSKREGEKRNSVGFLISDYEIQCKLRRDGGERADGETGRVIDSIVRPIRKGD